MKSTVGRPRIFTDRTIAEILLWHDQVLAWKALGAHLKSLGQLARELGVSPATIGNVIAQRGAYKKGKREGRFGRRRALTQGKVAVIMSWHRKIRRWRALGASLKSQQELARELGVARSTVSYVIAHRGQYKQPAPETRDREFDERYQRIAQLRKIGYL